MNFGDVTDQELLAGLEGVVRRERGLVAKMLAYLAEVEERRLHLEIACSSMHDFCTRKLGLSEDQACRRIAVARIARRYPQLLDALAEGRLHLSGVDRLRPYLTDENVDAVIDAAAGKSRRELDELIARLAPKPDVPDGVRVMPQQATLQPAAETATTSMPSARASSDETRPTRQVMPLSEARFVVTFTMSRAQRDKLEAARGLTRHRNPSGDLASVVENAIDLLLTALEKQKHAKAKRPRRAKPSADPGYVSADVRREVHERDEGRCAYVSLGGERCPARELLELDHRQPRALGGTGEASNVRLLCRPHNRHAAEQAFGREHIEQKIAAACAWPHPLEHAAPPRQRGERSTVEHSEIDEPARPSSEAREDGEAERISSDAREDGEAERISAVAREDGEAERISSDAREDGTQRAMAIGSSRETSIREAGIAVADPQQPRRVQTRAASGARDHGDRGGDAALEAACDAGDARAPRDIARTALLGLGFRAGETDRALDALSVALWSEPLESILRAALARLT